MIPSLTPPSTTNDGQHGAAPTWVVRPGPGPSVGPATWTGYQPAGRPPEAAAPSWSPPPGQAPLAVTNAPLAGQAPLAVTNAPIATSVAAAPGVAPRARRSRTADLALVVAAFVATAGVAFAVGRWSMPPSTTTPAGLAGVGAFPGSALPAIAAGTAADDRSRPAAAADTASDGTIGLPEADGTAEEGADGQPAAAGQGTGAPPGADGSSPGGMGQGPGMGPGGLEGTVLTIAEGSLTVTTDDGTSMSVVTDAATTWVRETPIAATDIQSGDRVSVEMPFGGFGRGQADTEQTLVAEQVTLLPE